jgi:hypothetical protein
MDAVFIELPAFERHREDYLDDERYRELQRALLHNPQAGALVEGAGGLRKMRFADPRRGKGVRGGLRVIYYYWMGGPEFWLFTVYDKSEMADLSPAQREAFRVRVKDELRKRGS